MDAKSEAKFWLAVRDTARIAVYIGFGGGVVYFLDALSLDHLMMPFGALFSGMGLAALFIATRELNKMREVVASLAKAKVSE